MIHSSSECHSSIPHDGQVNWLGFFPSTQSILAHLPHNIEVRIGSSRVVSILNIGRPASDINEASGVQESCALIFPSSSSTMLSPIMSKIIPPIDKGTDIDIEKAELSYRMILDPNAMHIQAEITIFSRRLDTPGSAPMCFGGWGWISALLRR